MTDHPTSYLTAIDAAFGKALLDQFFEPLIIGRNPVDGTPVYGQSGLAALAQQLYRQHASLILENVWSKIDIEDLAAKVAAQVVHTLTVEPGRWDTRRPEQTELHKRVLELVAQQLGQRVVDQMDLQLTSRPAVMPPPLSVSEG